MAANHHVMGQMTVIGQMRIGLGDIVLGFFRGGKIVHLIGDLAVLYPAIGAFDKAIFVYQRIGRKRVDQPDIGAFRGLDRADPAIMGRMHIAYFKPGAFAGQPPRTQR